MEKEERFQEIDSEIETWSEDEKKFALWLLLRNFYNINEKEIPKVVNTINDYSKDVFYRRLLVDCNEIIDILRFELWR